MRTRSSFLALVATLVIGACDVSDGTTTTSQAITNGIDDPDDPAVVALLASPEQASCTGTLVSPRVVVTAGHCVNRGMFNVFFGTAPALGGEMIPVIDARAHPQFDFSKLTYDIGVLLLASDASVPSVPMWPGTFDDANIIGRGVRFAGFGATAIATLEPSTKRYASATIAELNPQKFTFYPTPSQPCVGDSGGPGFFTDDGIEYLAGVTSSGDPMCMAFARMTRIDIGRTEFIEPYIEQTRPRSQGLGAICYYDENCASGKCIAATDDPKLRYCSHTCSGPDDCLPSMECAGTCRYRTPTPGTQGTSCTNALQCASNMCLAASPGEQVCSSRCQIDAQCGDGFICQDFDDDPKLEDKYCIPTPPPPEETGCSVGAPYGAANAMLVLLALWRSRRRRNAAR